MRGWLLGAVLMGAVSAAGCSTRSIPELESSEVEEHRSKQGVEVLQAFAEYRSRLKRIEYRVRVDAAPFCASLVRPEGGVLIGGGEGFGDATVDEIAAQAFALGEAITVVYVVPESPVALAGLRVGDEFVALDGTQVEDVEVLSRFVAESQGRPLHMTVWRKGERVDFEVELPLACNFGVTFSPRDSLLTWSADKWTIVVPVGLMRIADDDELGLAIAHQLAHALIELSAIPIPNPESEADVLGLYMAAAAGFDVTVAVPFWERMAAETPRIIGAADSERQQKSHMGVADRLARIERTSYQLAGRLARGESIAPVSAQ